MRNITEIPEKWVVLEMKENNLYKVFATFTGGYSSGDRWNINSGIKSVEQDETFFYFNGFSGSCYKCHKKGYGIASSYGDNILKRILEKSEGRVNLMKDDSDWINLDYN